LDRDGEWELCCLPDLYESELVACNLDGSLSYHEAFGKSCGGLVVLEENGMEHLLILVGNEVRIYP
ncbi:hypothetical protein KDL30_16740, partial [bacterium]|nr:hypothetical protein [bacterium]